MLNERYDGSKINEGKAGLARELARMNLTLNSYTQWYWKTDLLNLLNFLFCADSHAQYEIRVYAETMLDTVKMGSYNSCCLFRLQSRCCTCFAKGKK